MIDFREYYQKYLKYSQKERIFGKYDPELKEASKYIKSKGFLSKKDLQEIAQWKSPRHAKDTLKNEEKEVEDATGKVFGSNVPEDRISDLDNLKGIGIPTASAILCVYDPENYGVVDIYAWNTLSEIDQLFQEKKYSSFTVGNYKKYLDKIRYLAKENNMTCRQIDMALWAWGKGKQAIRYC